MNKKLIREILIYAGIILSMLVLSYGFVPQVLSGKIVNQNDISGWQGMAREAALWNAEHTDDKTHWTDSMFGGMPTVTIIDDFEGDWTKALYNALLWGRRPGSYLFLAMLGAFLMMLAMGVNRFLAVAGAVAVTFCAYNLQIIQVGHNTKMQAIAFAPWAIAALIFTFRRAFTQSPEDDKRKIPAWLPLTILGAVLFGLALSFQIKANHVQITYYLAIIILFYAIATFIWLLKKENRHLIGRFFAAAALLLVTGIVGIGTNANKLIPTASYTPYTMRGGSELTQPGTNSKGLSIDYATAWSYGIGEMPNLMIPNFNGGSSIGSVGENSAMWQLYKRAGQNPAQACENLPLYWGPQPFTAGPMYMGAISIFLFVLGLFLLKGREKWWLLACCIFATFLAWGNHFLWFTELMFKYAPMYNKFRSVSMALVVLQFCVPLLGIYTLDRIVKEQYDGKQVVNAIWWSLAITAGFCLLSALIPSIAGNFKSASDGKMHELISKALCEDRRMLLQKDAWRSFILIVLSAGAIMWSFLKADPFVTKGRLNIAAVIIGVLILFDMWSVGKRYLNEGHFITPRKFASRFEDRPVDKMILKDKSLSYRVLDLAEDTFNSSVTSYRHKSIGGYSPTKMQRYQDLISHYLTGEINAFYTMASKASTLEDIENNMPAMPIVSMLNGKYIIVSPQYPPVVNKNAMGAAWFVDGLYKVDTPDEEIAALGVTDLHRRAVVRNLSEGADSFVGDGCPNAARSIEMTSYAPNEVRYRYSASQPSVAVFSEIFHPSWKATLNGEPLSLMCVDWVLRGAVLPAGEGEVVMRYEPEDYAEGALISRICGIVLLLLICFSAAALFIKK